MVDVATSYGGSLGVSNHRHRQFKFPMIWMWLLFLQLTTTTPSITCSDVQGTNFSFAPFAPGDKLLQIGDASMSSNFASVLLNSNASKNEIQKYSCGRLIYDDSVPLRSASSSLVASFSTSFTFSITGHNSAGFAFTIVNDKFYCGSGGASMCLLNKTMNGSPSNHMFAVEFDTWRNPEFGDPSNNHIGVNVNSMNSLRTYNLCGNSGGHKTFNCNYFDTGADFTSWIDYDGTNQKLEVRVANGSSIVGVAKPSNPIITILELNLSSVFQDNMYVGFSGSVGLYGEVHEIKSWSFQSSLSILGDNNIIKVSRVSLIVGVVGVAGAFTVVALIGLVCLLKKRKEKRIEKKEKNSLKL